MKAKSLALVSLSVVAGVSIGAGGMAALHRPDHFGSEYPGMIRGMTAEHVLHAKLLREGRGTEVLRMIESTFPSSVLHFEMFNLRKEVDIVQLWRIREYGEKHRIEYPPAVAGLLARLPPKPVAFCDIEEEGKMPNKAPATPASVTPRATEDVLK